ncbi:alanine racemase [Chitinilyticum piscinae]|uniref:Alanine racemase n=1 Tax=Chitinilyticum piscinae TaxID=2866724 RepID=A0A8J7K275_9NEIS|nr:alanine racemase [Chitinilyticum piscinae]MBE9610181.1 alanine racemase [Chitinilyticum piscinae]
MSRPLHATIDSTALTHNLAQLQARAGSARVLSVVKANAYGHGLARVAPALANTDGWATLELDSAIHLREQGYTQPIVLLEGVFAARELEICSQYRIGCAVHGEHQLAWLREAKLPAPVDVLLKLNTGMNRLGFPPERAPELVGQVRQLPAVAAVTVMTHFATADEPDKGIAVQYERFRSAIAGLDVPVSLANSAALLAYPQARGDWVRPGIALYGSSPFADRSAQSLGLRAVMTLQSAIIGVQELHAGDAVGYGATFVADRNMRVGTVACGYADGYPRHAGTGTPVLVAGQRTRLLGRVSMDMLAVDLTPIPAAGIGSPVELWGRSLSVDEVAAAAGTIAYELLCAVAPRVPFTVA